MASAAPDLHTAMKQILLASCTLLALAAATLPAQQVRFDDVVRNLRNPDPRARLSSIAMLRDSKYLEAIEPLAPLVTDPVDEIQLAAIEAELSFYLVDDVSARKRVAFIVEVRNSGRAETAFASGPLAVWPRPVPDVLMTHLLGAVDDENAKVRIEALYTLGAIARAPLAPAHAERLVTALDHYDPAIRRAAARVAGRLGVAAAGEMLIKAVNDSQPPVRFAAMRALGEIREATAVQALTQQFEHYRKGEGAWSALDGLARIGHASSVPLFKARLTDRDEYVRRAALEGLARARAVEEAAAIETAAAADSSPMVRAAAAFALESLGKDGIDRLAGALDSDRLASQIAGYVFELGPGVAPRLVPHLKAMAPSVRGNVAVILGAIGTAGDIPALEPLILDRDADVRRAAERAIQRIKVRGA
jgi:HEAT repeat protein